MRLAGVVLTVIMNVLGLVMIPLQVAFVPASPEIKVIQLLAWTGCLVMFIRYCRVKLREWRTDRVHARRIAKLKGSLRYLIEQMAEAFGKDTALRFLASMNAAGDPITDYFGRLIAEESARRQKSLHGYFDEHGHFVMEEMGDPVDVTLAWEMEHPDPDTMDDLDNSWEPPS